MKKVLLIGNPNSIWTKEYVKNIHKHNNVTITVYNEISDAYLKEYNKLNVQMIVLGKNNITKAFRFIKFAITNRGKIDIVDIQSPPHSIQSLIIAIVIRIINSRAVVSFWGSDIMRINHNDARMLIPIIKSCDKINLGTNRLTAEFKKYYKDHYCDKICNAKFGSLALSQIDLTKKNYTSEQCKKIIGIDSEKISVAIGYNGNVEQQHIKCLNEISQMSDSVKSKVQLIIHMGYGCSEDYFERVKEIANSTNIGYLMIDKMYDLEEIAVLRVATDIMIHAQTTDALSGSIRECLYAGTILINPSWITYDEFSKLGINYLQYNSFDELSCLLEDTILKIKEYDTSKNSSIINDYYSWEYQKKNWDRFLYE